MAGDSNFAWDDKKGLLAHQVFEGVYEYNFKGHVHLARVVDCERPNCLLLLDAIQSLIDFMQMLHFDDLSFQAM